MNKETHPIKLRRRNVRLVTVSTILATILLLQWACGGNNDKSPSCQSLPANAASASLDSLFTSILDSDYGPGGIIIVTRGDSMVYRHAFGYADLEKGIRISDSTLFNMSSASKVFTSVALLKLAEQGRINLDDPLSMFFPELPGHFFDRITIRHILTHSTGLPDLRPRNDEEWKSYLVRHKSVFGFSNDYRLYGSEKEHMQVFVKLDDVDFEPGTHYQNNDPGYILIAPLIERVTGEKFDQWMADNIFKPAGMDGAFYRNAGERTPDMAHAYRLYKPDSKLKSYRSKDGKWEEFDYGEADFFLTKADRGVYSSARDFIKWNKALYGGKLISDSSLRELRTPYIPTDVEYASFGLGSPVRQEPGYPDKVYHINANGGFAIAEGSWPDARLSYIVFTNRNDWDRRAVTYALDSIFKSKGWL